MLNLFIRYRHITIFCVFVLLSLVLLSLKQPVDTLKTSNVFERGMLTVLQPFQRSISGVAGQFQHVWQRYVALIHLQDENQQLRLDIEQLQVERTRHLEKSLAYDRLKGILHLVEERDFSMILARVIAYDPTNQSNTMLVDKGSKDGVQESCPVIAQGGVVGITVGVSENASKILLLTDPNCNISAIIQRTRDQGIVGGQSKKDAYTMKYVSQRADIREGVIYRLSEESLRELAQEGLPGFQLTEQGFLRLQEKGIAPDILTILQELKDRVYPTQQNFLSALEQTIGKEQAEWRKPILLEIGLSDVLAKLQSLRDQIYQTEDDFLKTLETTLGKEATEKYRKTILQHAREEETVISSGLGGIFPKGLLIGKVSKVMKQDYGQLFQDIEITPSVDFSKLEEILIIRRESIPKLP